MTATNAILAVEQGATFHQRVLWNSAAGTPVDLTGYSAHMQIRKADDAMAVMADLTDISGLTLGGLAGTIDILLTSAQTAAFDTWRAVYDLTLIAPSGDRTRLLEGAVTIDPQVTVTA